MKPKRKRQQGEVNSSSMADIAFLLLIFFLVTTTIVNEKGVPFVLPPKKDDVKQEMELHDRNVFKVVLNSQDKLLVEDDRMELSNLKNEAKLFLDNFGKDPKYSDNPNEAVVSFKADRGTSYEMFIKVLNELKASYHELRADELGISKEDYLTLKHSDNKEYVKMYNKAAELYPMQLSIAEPTDYGKYGK